MAFDIEMIRNVYKTFAQKVEHARAVKGGPLTLAEKILYAHLYDEADAEPFVRGTDYVNFRPVWPCRMQRHRWPCYSL